MNFLSSRYRALALPLLLLASAPVRGASVPSRRNDDTAFMTVAISDADSLASVTRAIGSLFVGGVPAASLTQGAPEASPTDGAPADANPTEGTPDAAPTESPAQPTEMVYVTKVSVVGGEEITLAGEGAEGVETVIGSMTYQVAAPSETSWAPESTEAPSESATEGQWSETDSASDDGRWSSSEPAESTESSDGGSSASGSSTASSSASSASSESDSASKQSLDHRTLVTGMVMVLGGALLGVWTV